MVHHRSHVRVMHGIAYLQGLNPLPHAIHKDVVNLALHDGAGTRGALLPAESKRRTHHTLNRCVDISIGAHDDRVFPAHFKNGSLDPDLARLVSGRTLVDIKTYFFGSCERNEARLGVLDNRVAKCGSRARTEIHHSRRPAGLLQSIYS